MGCTVRVADAGDYLAVAKVHAASWREAYRGLVADQFLDTIDPAQWARRYDARSDSDSSMLLAEHGRHVIGMVRFGPDRQEPDAGEIYALYVTPREQRHGAGTALLNAALQQLPQTVVRLWCATANITAQSFYIKHGFTADGAVDDYAVGDSTVPVKRYALDRGRQQMMTPVIPGRSRMCAGRPCGSICA